MFLSWRLFNIYFLCIKDYGGLNIYLYSGMSLSNLTGVAGTAGGQLVSAPLFRATKATDSKATGNATFTNYDAVSGTLASQFSTTTGNFTPTVSGTYSLTAKFYVSAGAPSTGDIVIGVRSASDLFIEFNTDSYLGGELTPTASGYVYLTAGVPVWVYIYQTLANPATLTKIVFSGCLVSLE